MILDASGNHLSNLLGWLLVVAEILGTSLHDRIRDLTYRHRLSW